MAATSIPFAYNCANANPRSPSSIPPYFPRRPFFFRSNSSLETLTVTALVIVTTTTTVVAFAWKDVQEARHGRLHPS